MLRMRLGMFDPPSMQPFRSYSVDDVDTEEHRVRIRIILQSIDYLLNFVRLWHWMLLGKVLYSFRIKMVLEKV